MAFFVRRMGAVENRIDARACRRHFAVHARVHGIELGHVEQAPAQARLVGGDHHMPAGPVQARHGFRSEEHTSELQSPCNLVCRLLLEKKKNTNSCQRTCTSEHPLSSRGFANTVTSASTRLLHANAMHTMCASRLPRARTPA